jgi:molecular chaperone DnaK
MEALGIDLGTTNTVAAIGREVLHLDPRVFMPSVVAFLPNGLVQTGSAARRRRSIDAENTIYSSKRIIGRTWDDPRTQEFRGRYPFHLTRVGEDPAFVTRAGLFTPTDVAAILLGTIFEKVRTLVPELQVVITVPPGFSEQQREATLAAARKAHLRRAVLIEEPVSTALAYLRRPDGSSERLRRVAVYDLGGGTFDFAVVDCAGREPRVLRSASDMFLGGDDVDARIADWVATEVLKRDNWDITNHPEIQDRLLAECELAKIRLSSEAETRIDLSQVDPELPSASECVPLRRELLDRLSEQLVRRTFVTCDHVLRELGLQPADIDAVLMAGGSTHLPAVKHGVEAYFGRPGRSDVDPIEVVALGAALAVR